MTLATDHYLDKRRVRVIARMAACPQKHVRYICDPANWAHPDDHLSWIIDANDYAVAAWVFDMLNSCRDSGVKLP